MFSASTSRVGDAYMRRRSSIYSSPPRPIPLPPPTGLPQTPARGDTAVSSGLIHTHTHTQAQVLKPRFKSDEEKTKVPVTYGIGNTFTKCKKITYASPVHTLTHTHTHTHSFTNSTTPLRLHITGRPARDSRRRPA